MYQKFTQKILQIFVKQVNFNSFLSSTLIPLSTSNSQLFSNLHIKPKIYNNQVQIYMSWYIWEQKNDIKHKMNKANL